MPGYSPVLIYSYRYSSIRIYKGKHAPRPPLTVLIYLVSTRNRAYRLLTPCSSNCCLTENFSSADGILVNRQRFFGSMPPAPEDHLVNFSALWLHAICATTVNKKRAGLRFHCTATKVLVILSSDDRAACKAPRPIPFSGQGPSTMLVDARRFGFSEMWLKVSTRE